MKVNESSTDRLIRGIAAVVLLIAAFVVGMSKPLGIVLLVVAIIAGVTAAVGFCPLYRLFNFATKK